MTQDFSYVLTGLDGALYIEVTPSMSLFSQALFLVTIFQDNEVMPEATTVLWMSLQDGIKISWNKRNFQPKVPKVCVRDKAVITNWREDSIHLPRRKKTGLSTLTGMGRGGSLFQDSRGHIFASCGLRKGEIKLIRPQSIQL